MGLTSKFLALAAGVTLAAGTGLAAAATANATNAPLPPYPNTIPLNLGSPNCVTDDVIMNDPSTSLVLTAGSDGSPVVFSQATYPITYKMSYWDGTSPESNNANWTAAPPPGVQINPGTGVISAYNPGEGEPALPLDQVGAGTIISASYKVRVTGTDAHTPEGAAGVEQFQLNVNNNGSTTTVSYGGNDSDNANSVLNIGLNSNGTQLLLNATFLGEPNPNPDASPIKFTLDPSQPGWHLSGVSPTAAVLTGAGVSDPNIEATTNNGDKVFFHLTGISTDSGGNFFENNDVNPCVTGPAPTPTPSPTPTGTGTPPPPVNTADCTSSYGNEVNAYGNGLDVWQQHGVYGQPVAVWPATQFDVATHWLCIHEGGNVRFEYAPHGAGTGLCASNPGDDLVVLRTCNPNVWQQWIPSGRYLKSAVNGWWLVPNGKGSQWAVNPGHSPWGGDKLTWTDYTSLPV